MKKFAALIIIWAYLMPAHILAADSDAGKKKSAVCASCHGADGNSTNPAWPSLASQHPQYLYKQLKDFKQGARKNPLMSPQASGLSEEDMHDLAAYFGAQTINPASADKKAVAMGAKVYRGGIAARGIPACMACHGPDGTGNPPAGFPRLSYQHAQYVANQLRAFRSGNRHNSPHGMMHTIAAQLKDKEIKAVAQYVAGLHRRQGSDKP